MTKTGNCLTMISLDLNYGLHHCNTEKVLVYSPDTNNCVHLKEDRIQKSAVISFSMGLEQEPRFRLSLTAKRSAEDEVVSVCLCSRLLFSNSICKLSVHKKSRSTFLFNTCTMAHFTRICNKYCSLHFSRPLLMRCLFPAKATDKKPPKVKNNKSTKKYSPCV